MLIKRKYNIIVTQNKQLQILLRDNKIALIVQHNYTYKTLENNFNLFDFSFEFLFKIKVF